MYRRVEMKEIMLRATAHPPYKESFFILTWMVRKDEFFEPGDTICTLTDTEAIHRLDATCSGQLRECFFEDGEVIAPYDILGTYETEANPDAPFILGRSFPEDFEFPQLDKSNPSS